MLARLAHIVNRHRWPVIAAWVVLTLFGGFAAGKVSKRWYQSFSIPGKSAYEANQRTMKTFGVGVRPPAVVVYHTQGDATKSAAIKASMARVAAANPGGADELVLHDAQQSDVRLEGPAHHLQRDLPARLARRSTRRAAPTPSAQSPPQGLTAGSRSR